MKLADVLELAYLPAIAIIGVKDSPQARVMMLSIGLQESRFQYRRQMGNGPAKSFWQFERGGGVLGVLNHPASKGKAADLCRARGVAPDSMYVWNKMEFDDVLGAGLARLLLLTDPKPLPRIDDTQGAWAYYVNNWRPGKPHIGTWPACHDAAVKAGAYL